MMGLANHFCWRPNTHLDRLPARHDLVLQLLHECAVGAAALVGHPVEGGPSRGEGQFHVCRNGAAPSATAATTAAATTAAGHCRQQVAPPLSAALHGASAQSWGFCEGLHELKAHLPACICSHRPPQRTWQRGCRPHCPRRSTLRCCSLRPPAPRCCRRSGRRRRRHPCPSPRTTGMWTRLGPAHAWRWLECVFFPELWGFTAAWGTQHGADAACLVDMPPRWPHLEPDLRVIGGRAPIRRELHELGPGVVQDGAARYAARRAVAPRCRAGAVRWE